MQAVAGIISRACAYPRLKLFWSSGDDIDQAAHCLITEQGTRAALDDFDTLNVMQIDTVQVGAGPVTAVVETTSIHQYQRVGAGSWAKTAHINGGALAISGQVIYL